MQRNDLIILAVDDDMINLKLLKSMLGKSGKVKEVIEAKNGSDAIGHLKSRDDIDLILLDIIMPIMGGIDMLKVVRAGFPHCFQMPLRWVLRDQEVRHLCHCVLGNMQCMNQECLPR